MVNQTERNGKKKTGRIRKQIVNEIKTGRILSRINVI